MKDRILSIRKDNKLTQDEFAARLDLSKNYIWQIEKGERFPSPRTISSIGKEFGVNVEWIKTGKGEKYYRTEDEVSKALDGILSRDTPFYDIIKSIIKTYDQLDSKSQGVIQEFAQQLLDDLKRKDD